MLQVLNLKTIICLWTLFAFFGNLCPLPPAHAQELALPSPGTMVHLSPSFNPPVLKGIKVHPDNPLRFDFILDKGDSQESGQALKSESAKLIKYFMTSLTIPEKDLWVNLSPYEKDRIVPEGFGQTEMGRDLLAQDYILKQITASLIYPEGEVGKKFWQRIYEESAKKFGATSIPVNPFNKVWIVPEKAVVYENAKAGTAYVVESKLKVMLEQDYLAQAKNIQAKSSPEEVSSLGSQIVREVVIPELTREVNSGQNFAQLRQVYNSLILATWYKKKIKDSILSQAYLGKNKVAGISLAAQEKQKIYERYLQAFKKGAFNLVKEEQDPITKNIIPRKYFSGGAEFFGLDKAMVISENETNLRSQKPEGSEILSVKLDAIGRAVENRPDLFSSIEALRKAQLETQQLSRRLGKQPFLKVTETGRVVSYVVFMPGNDTPLIFQGEVPPEVLNTAKFLFIFNIARTLRPGNLGANLKTQRKDENDETLWQIEKERQNVSNPDVHWLDTVGKSGNPWYVAYNQFPIMPLKEGEWFTAPEMHSLILVRSDGRVHQRDMNQYDNLLDSLHFLTELNNSKNIGDNLFRLAINGTYYSSDALAPQGGTSQLQAHAQLNRLVYPIESAERQFLGAIDNVRIGTLANWFTSAIVLEADNTNETALASVMFKVLAKITGKGDSFNVLMVPAGKNKTRIYIADRILWTPPLHFTTGAAFSEIGGAYVVSYPNELFEMSEKQLNRLNELPLQEKISWISNGLENGDLRVKSQLFQNAQEVLKTLTVGQEEVNGIVKELLLENKDEAMTVIKLDPAKIFNQDNNFMAAVRYFNEEIIGNHSPQAIPPLTWEKIVNLYEIFRADRINPEYSAEERRLRLNYSPNYITQKANIKETDKEKLFNHAIHVYSIIVNDQIFTNVPGFNKVHDTSHYAMGFQPYEGHHRLAWFIMNYILVNNGYTPFYFRHKDEYYKITGITQNMNSRLLALLGDSVQLTDAAMQGLDKVTSGEKGGIDFNADKMDLQLQNAGQEIKFHIDPSMLQQLQDAPGFTPSIINIQPMASLRAFLGLADRP